MHTSSVAALALSVLTGACMVTSPVSDGAPTPGGDVGQPTPMPTPNAGSGIAGEITSSTTWSGAVELAADATIAAGVEVTIAAGTAFTAADGAKLRVLGTLVVAGDASANVTMEPAAGAISWGGIVAEAGGAVTIEHARGSDVASLLYCHSGALTCAIRRAEFSSIGNALIAESVASIEKSSFVELANGGVTVRAGGDLTITDTYLITSDHDLVIASGGRLTIDHSEIGGAQGSYEHCDLHIGGAEAVSVTNSNIISGIYGVMIGATDGAVFQRNNFMGNDPGNDILQIGTNSNGDMRFNYWDQGAPALAGVFDTSSPAAQPHPDAGPRM